MRLDHITPKQFDYSNEHQIAVCEDENEPKVRRSQNTESCHIPNLLKRGPGRDSVPEFLDDHRALEPPDPIPNSVVKRCIADGSVGFPHVRVGHRQAPNW